MTHPIFAADRLRLDRPASWAVIGAGAGLVAEVSVLPSAVKGVLLLGFILVGPGSAVVQFWSTDMPTHALRALVPVVGFCVVVLGVSLGLLLGFWSPRLSLLGLAALTAGAGLLGIRRGSHGGLGMTERARSPQRAVRSDRPTEEIA